VQPGSDDDTKKEDPKKPDPSPPVPIKVDPPAPEPKPVDPIPPPPAPDPHAAELERLKQEQERIKQQQAELKREQERLAQLKRETPPVVDPIKNKSEEVKPPVVESAYNGPSSGTLVWEGTVHSKGELVTIDNGVANKGSVVSGKLPGVAVLIQSDNAKKVAIASPPGPDNKFQRVVLRVQGNGPQKVVLSWSLP
jgi:hypothetical protein